MAKIIEGLEIIVPLGGDVKTLIDAPGWQPFNENVISFTTDLSRALMKNREARLFPEIISLAHWMRPKAIMDLAAQYASQQPPNSVRMSRGVALHFAPGNVDTIFLYSALLSVLMGNKNIVRISARQSPQIELLVAALNSILKDPNHVDIRERIMIVRYGHDADITQELSNLCDIRIVWGGDSTVNEIRSFPLPPRARDISFPNRWSLAVLDAAHIEGLSSNELSTVAKDFVNDAYWFGQMACSSPRLVVWRGDHRTIEHVAKRFWEAARAEANSFESDISPVAFVNKLVSQDIAAIDGQVNSIRQFDDNIVSVGTLSKIAVPEDDLFVGEGIFWEFSITELVEIQPILDARSQTLVSLGITAQEWSDLVVNNGLKIDRIVPFGQALQFGHIWDGMNLLDEFSRLVSIDI